MVDGVKLAVIYQVHDVRHLDDGHSVILQDHVHAAGKTVEIGHVGQHVVEVEHVRPSALPLQLSAQLFVEEVAQSRNAPLSFSDSCDVGGRLDAQDRDAGLLVVLEQVTVIARYLNGQTGAVEAPRR